MTQSETLYSSQITDMDTRIGAVCHRHLHESLALLCLATDAVHEAQLMRTRFSAHRFPPEQDRIIHSHITELALSAQQGVFGFWRKLELLENDLAQTRLPIDKIISLQYNA